MKTPTESGTVLIKNRRIVCKGEKRVVLAGRREMKQIIFKDPLCVFMKIFFVSHEMCRKIERERKRKKER
jgi:hypothetical protein